MKFLLKSKIWGYPCGILPVESSYNPACLRRAPIGRTHTEVNSWILFTKKASQFSAWSLPPSEANASFWPQHESSPWARKVKSLWRRDSVWSQSNILDFFALTPDRIASPWLLFLSFWLKLQLKERSKNHSKRCMRYCWPIVLTTSVPFF